jgi:hypothetical protein
MMHPKDIFPKVINSCTMVLNIFFIIPLHIKVKESKKKKV